MSKNVSKASGRGGGQQTWKQDKSEPPEAGDPTRSLKASHYLDKLMNLYSLPFFFLKKVSIIFILGLNRRKSKQNHTHLTVFSVKVPKEWLNWTEKDSRAIEKYTYII